MQSPVNRHRLGLEGAGLPDAFLAAWDARFADFRTWQACKRREVYRENWIDWDRRETAREFKAFAFFESELPRADLTLPRPGGLVDWQSGALPAHNGLTLLQHREPAKLTAWQPGAAGYRFTGPA